MARLHAVLFDLDGTLLDTAPDMVRTLNELLAEHGRAPLPFDAVRNLVSHGSSRLIQLGFPDAAPSAFDSLQRRYLDIYAGSLSAGTRLFVGMDDVLLDIARRGLRSGIITNKPGWLTEPLLRQLGLTARFDCVVSGDTLQKRKPDPMPMLHAAALAGVSPGACVYLGDAQRDVQAAHAAGMEALVATYGYLEPDENWRAWGGDGSIAQPLDLLVWLDQSGRV